MVWLVLDRCLQVGKYFCKVLINYLPRLDSVQLNKHVVDDLPAQDRVVGVARVLVDEVPLPASKGLQLSSRPASKERFQAVHYFGCLGTVLDASGHHSLELGEETLEVTLSEEDLVDGQLLDLRETAVVDVDPEEELLLEGGVDSLSPLVVLHGFTDGDEEIDGRVVGQQTGDQVGQQAEGRVLVGRKLTLNWSEL